MNNFCHRSMLGKSRPTKRKKSTANEWVEEPIDEDHEDEPSFFNRRNSTMKAVGNESSVLTSMSFASLQIPECKPAEGTRNRQTIFRAVARCPGGIYEVLWNH